MGESFKQLIVWQKSMELVFLIYDLTARFPKEERFGLCSQMRRASVSIPSNIAEGYRRKGLGQYIHFLTIADASSAELETQLLLVDKLYPQIDTKKCFQLLIEIQKMLYVLILRLSENRSLTL